MLLFKFKFRLYLKLILKLSHDQMTLCPDNLNLKELKEAVLFSTGHTCTNIWWRDGARPVKTVKISPAGSVGHLSVNMYICVCACVNVVHGHLYVLASASSLIPAVGPPADSHTVMGRKRERRERILLFFPSSVVYLFWFISGYFRDLVLEIA